MMQAILGARVCFVLVQYKAKHAPEVTTHHPHKQCEEGDQQEATLTGRCQGCTKDWPFGPVDPEPSVYCGFCHGGAGFWDSVVDWSYRKDVEVEARVR